MEEKETKIWSVTYIRKEDKKQVGPAWRVDSKIKPTKLAKERCSPENTYIITLEKTVDEYE